MSNARRATLASDVVPAAKSEQSHQRAKQAQSSDVKLLLKPKRRLARWPNRAR